MDIVKEVEVQVYKVTKEVKEVNGEVRPKHHIAASSLGCRQTPLITISSEQTLFLSFVTHICLEETSQG